MAKWQSVEMIDAGLDFLGTAVNRIAIATAACTTFANIATNAIGTLAVTAGNFTKAAGDSSGRKSTPGRRI